MRRRAGFTLVEALLCVVLVSMLALVSSAFLPATQGAAVVQEDAVVLNHVRGKLEELIAAPATTLSGDDTLVVRGAPLVRSWWANRIDLDGNAAVESDAYLVHVEMGQVQLETIRTDPSALAPIKR
jgi:prepilin-type N-terminal cleavage/methylation domain-containing protein